MAADMSPTARALRALELLQSRPGITADRLAGALDVTERAARRYVAILREAGIPVDSARGPYGGYHLGRGVRMPPLTFTATEAVGLVMAVLDGHHDAGDPADPVGSALGKIVRGLPEPLATQVEAIRRATAPAPDRAAARPDPTTTTDLVHACLQHRRVRIEYRSEAGTRWTTDVDPWAIVVRHGRWYLLCWSHSAHDRRAYRVDRIGEIGPLGSWSDVVTPQLDFDPVAALEEQLAVGWEYDTEVVINAPLESCRRCLPGPLGRLERIDDATTCLVGSTSNPYWYAEQLTATPGPFRVVGGSELVATVRALGTRLLAAVE